MSKNLSALKSRLAIYKAGLRKAIQAEDHAEIRKWETSIDTLQKEIDDVIYARWHC
ncbi:hypothetical protein EDD70_1181 [Hydrogenoanaerobacterium saccharovorans]|uniref:Uncharacterized protein n=1 Tax=Hydrogenoanaerobacterium saccharovorans TaxID=474960 RepID=A0A1H7ZV03_9FIRM|nr:hypothetical protein [Hydrogenoanaerobacterium saccharovorans]RPF48365.1 hypothetical protein EDD70_1181 [Hydrogenoanaerobacterium saccharovorans]SEM62161.1 hypothetical protein SAMN05216180_0910 [Hydrogenoanaerobacterium saccharovorans]